MLLTFKYWFIINFKFRAATNSIQLIIPFSSKRLQYIVSLNYLSLLKRLNMRKKRVPNPEALQVLQEEKDAEEVVEMLVPIAQVSSLSLARGTS